MIRQPRLPQLLCAWLCAFLCACHCAAADGAAALEYRVAGLEREAARNVRLHLGTLDPALRSQPERLEHVIQRALDAALQPFGWYESSFTLGEDKGRLRIEVAPGPRVSWGPASIRVDEPAAALPELAPLLRKHPFTEGRPLSHADYDRYREDLLQRCRRLGFFDARYRTSELRIDRAQRQARAVLVLESGARYRFATTAIAGTQVEPSLLQQLAPFRAGEPFDGAKLQRFEQRLRDTGYFRTLAVGLRREAPDLAHVTVLAEDLDTSRYDIGAGFSTDSDLRLRFNRISPLLNEHGHSLAIESEFSETRQTLEATLRVPHTDPLDDIFEFTSGLQGKRVEDTDSLTATTGVRHAMRVFGDWTYAYGISAELERYTVGSESEKNVAYLLPATSIARTRLDPGIDPLNGFSVWTALDFSDPAIGAPAHFVRWRGSAKWLHGFNDDNTTLLARLDLGAVWTDGFNQVPASLRFYAGGDRSIRGYDFEALGPRDINGKLIGGRYLGVGSVEVSRRVRPDWRLAAFLDGGSAYTEKSDKFYQSAGIGVRWLSPIGQIRIDLAAPVADRENSGLKLHISMGPPL